MTAEERLRQLAAALPSQHSAVTLTKGDLLALVAEDGEPVRVGRDMTVEEVAEETRRAPSTVRGWLVSGDLRGYKLNGRDWRISRLALQRYLTAQDAPPEDAAAETDGDDISAWRCI